MRGRALAPLSDFESRAQGWASGVILWDDPCIVLMSFNPTITAYVRLSLLELRF